MTDQEIINNYLIKNPLKSGVRNKDKYLPRYCAACSRKVSSKKKKPLTVFQGEMNSTTGLKIDSFPRGEDEDLCNTCKTSIRFYSKDLDDQYKSKYLIVDENTKIYNHDFDRSVHYFTDNLDADYLESEMQYQGYDDYESMEGTFYQLGEDPNN